MAALFSEADLRAVTVEAVRRYFTRMGWTWTPMPGGGDLYENPNERWLDTGTPVTYRFADHEKYADYPLRVEDLLSALGDWENRSMLAVWRDLTAPVSPANGTPATNGAAHPSSAIGSP